MWCILLVYNIDSCFSVYTEQIVQPHVYEPERIHCLWSYRDGYIVFGPPYRVDYPKLGKIFTISGQKARIHKQFWCRGYLYT